MAERPTMRIIDCDVSTYQESATLVPEIGHFSIESRIHGTKLTSLTTRRLREALDQDGGGQSGGQAHDADHRLRRLDLFTGVPHSSQTAPRPSTTVGPQAQQQLPKVVSICGHADLMIPTCLRELIDYKTSMLTDEDTRQGFSFY